MDAHAILILFAYAFVSNVAVAVVPHEPVVMWFGAHGGVWATAVVATGGTLVASVVDYRLFAKRVARLATRPGFSAGVMGWIRRAFGRAPFWIVAGSALTPIPSFPVKAVAFAERYPLGRYLGAVAVGRLPRYLLLAWGGYVLSLPTWAFVALTVAMLVISSRCLWQPQRGK